MKDQDLEELLDRWEVPPARAELREKVRSALRPPRKRRLFSFDLRAMFAGTTLGAGLGLLLLITQAFPQTLRVASPLFQIPYTVDSEFVDYDEHGTPKVDMYSTSYTDIDRGTEVLLSSSIPGEPLVTAVRRVIETSTFIWDRVFSTRAAWTGAADFVRSGCVNEGQPVVERITILGYPTVAVQYGAAGQPRMTLWMAPDLNCFVLRFRTEERQPDGFYRVVKERHALAVRVAGRLNSR